MKKIEAQIVADSISPQGHRITTFLLTFPRFILAELNTHRMFSRNSASSRAIPFEKMVKMVQEDPFIPIAWQKDHKGMQGTEYITDATDWGSLDCCRMDWLQARYNAVYMAESLHNLNVTKQLCNRLLEPFMWHTVLVTATEFENFFELRCPKYQTPVSGKEFYFRSKKDCITNHSDSQNIAKLEAMSFEEWQSINTSQAEIHIQALAEAMWDAINESTPKKLKAGEWHIPFGDNIQPGIVEYAEYYSNQGTKQIEYPSGKILREGKSPEESNLEFNIKVATACCARLSYMTFDNKIDYEKDIQLHDMLLKEGHFSPFEHCARTMSDLEYYSFIKGKYPTVRDGYGIINYEMMPISEDDTGLVGFKGVNPHNSDIYGWCNNFRGWVQYRYLIEN